MAIAASQVFKRHMVLSDEYQCAICFEDVEQTIEIPCACNVFYCAQCWDRSLAQSFNSTGEARCPTCRVVVCVDFDPEKNCLLFSRAPVPALPAAACFGARNWHEARQLREATKQEAVQKLRQQALPAQIRILQSHGRRNPELSQVARTPELQLRRMSVPELKRQHTILGISSNDCLDKDDLVCRLLQEANNKKMIGCLLGEKLASSTEHLPGCVCGSSLVRVTGAERTMRCCDKMPQLAGSSRDSPYYQNAFERLSALQRSVCFCDLCGDSVPTANAVWTCENGDSTILHATSYDVCDECFMRYAAFGDAIPSSTSKSVVDIEMTSGSQAVLAM